MAITKWNKRWAKKMGIVPHIELNKLFSNVKRLRDEGKAMVFRVYGRGVPEGNTEVYTFFENWIGQVHHEEPRGQLGWFKRHPGIPAFIIFPHYANH